MHTSVFRLLAFVVVLTGLTSPGRAQDGSNWYRGNTHAHTLNSDGDVTPDMVARWYREHGYHFTFITDHEHITDVGPLNGLFARAERFLVISGQEVSQRVADPNHPDKVRQAHVNALGVTSVVWPDGERYIANTSIAETYASNLAKIKARGGVMQVNHPNFRWSVPMEQMLSLPDSTMFELWNGHPIVYNQGGTDVDGNSMPSTEVLWDSLLSRGKLLFAVGDDDSHNYLPRDAENKDKARPGRAWIWVRADTLTHDAILASLRRGDFYASTGIRLADYRVTADSMYIDIAPYSDRRYLTEFIGHGGEVLSAVPGTTATYRFTGDELYVRARVTGSSGQKAWMQPVMR